MKCRTVKHLQRLYFNKIFKKNEKDNGSRADVVAKRKKDLFNDAKEGSTLLDKKLYSLNTEQSLQLKISNLCF